MRALPLCLILLAACDGRKTPIAPPTSDLGTGLNTVTKSYGSTVAEVMPACRKVVQELDLRPEKENGDALGGEIVARRATDDKVTLTVRSVDPATTSVAVRVGPGNRQMAGIVHEKLSAALGRPPLPEVPPR